MADQASTTANQGEDEGQQANDSQQQQDNGGQQQQGEAKFSQADVDRIVRERLARERAPKPGPGPHKVEANGDDPSAEILQRLQAAEQRAAEAEAHSIRSELAGSKGVPLDVLAGPESAEREALDSWADKLIAWRDEAVQQAAPGGPRSSLLNKSGENTVKGTTGDAFADFFTNHA